MFSLLHPFHHAAQFLPDPLDRVPVVRVAHFFKIFLFILFIIRKKLVRELAVLNLFEDFLHLFFVPLFTTRGPRVTSPYSAVSETRLRIPWIPPA